MKYSGLMYIHQYDPTAMQQCRKIHPSNPVLRLAQICLSFGTPPPQYGFNQRTLASTGPGAQNKWSCLVIVHGLHVGFLRWITRKQLTSLTTTQTFIRKAATLVGTVKAL